jgi:hypothetical protein
VPTLEDLVQERDVVLGFALRLNDPATR